MGGLALFGEIKKILTIGRDETTNIRPSCMQEKEDKQIEKMNRRN